MVKFIIEKQKVMKISPDYGVFDSTSKRIYISEIPSLRVESLVSQLLKISELESVQAIQIEFDRYKEQHYIEIELYLITEKNDLQPPNVNFDIEDAPCGCSVSERFYNEMISFLEQEQ